MWSTRLVKKPGQFRLKDEDEDLSQFPEWS